MKEILNADPSSGKSKDLYIPYSGLSVIGGLDYWIGLLEWTTGMDFDLFFFFPKS